jgi:hypothetical protein
VHDTVPQALLPLEPALREELEREEDKDKRHAAVQLAARLLVGTTVDSAGGSSFSLLDEYEPLLGAVLGRASDVDVSCWELGMHTTAP